MATKIDSHPRKQEVLALVSSGKMTIKEAAVRLGVSYNELWKYLKRRADQQTKVTAESLDEKIQLLSEVLSKVKELVEKILRDAHSGEGLRYGPNWIRELRNLVNDLAKLQAQIVDSPTILIQNVVESHNMLQTWLLTNLCDDCKRKLIKFLEENK